MIKAFLLFESFQHFAVLLKLFQLVPGAFFVNKILFVLFVSEVSGLSVTCYTK